MRITGRLSTRCLVLAIMALVFSGCQNTHEDRVKAWNDFWGAGKNRQRPVAKKPKANRPPAKREPAPKSPRTEAKADVPEDESVDRGDPEVIENYANSAQPRRYGDYHPDDHVSKIERQQDTHRASHNHSTMGGEDELAMRDPAFSGSTPAAETSDDSLEWPDSMDSGPVRTASVSTEQDEIRDWPPTPPVESEAPSGPETDSDTTSDAQPVEFPVVESHGNSPPTGGPSPIGETGPIVMESENDSGRVTANNESMTSSIHEVADDPLEPAKLSDLAPSLAEVNVSAAPEPVKEKPAITEKTDVAAEPVQPNEAPAPTAHVDTFADRLKAQEELVATDPNNVEEQYRLRMMYLINGQDDKALAPAEGVDADVQEIIRAQIQSLIDARSATGRDSAEWANRQLESVEELRRKMRSRADLAVPKVTLCTAIEGFGRYDPIEPTEFPAGRKNLVLVYIEVDNFTSEQTRSGLYRTLLSVRQELFNKAGESLWNKKDENIEDLARQKRRDFYLTIGPIAIPKTLPPGEYNLRVEVEDVLAGKLNSRAAEFTIVP